MKKIILTMAALGLFAATQVNAQQTLDQLLSEVQRAASAEGRFNQEREARFQRERNNQQQLLAQARQELAREERRSEQLQTEYDENERQLAEMETTLEERMGNLGELFGVVRQVAGDLETQIEDSMVSGQIPGRSQFFADLAQRSELPTANELRRLWYEMVREVAESGKVVSFTADVNNADGYPETGRTVTRVGVFNAISDGKFLQWDGSQDSFLELPRQPAGRFLSMAEELENAPAGSVVEFPVDFTRGVILSQVVKSPTLDERRRQGGPIGNMILILGAIGLLYALYKGIVLFFKGAAIKRQLKRDEPDTGNALGRVMAVYTENPNADIETLELKLDEAILRETAPLESGLSLIKVLYVVAPLMGLLGTVVGMIETFQQITLFGTGDPRMMAGGISMALTTTVQGLIVAIPLTIIHSMLQSRSRALVQILEEQAAGIIARLAESGHAGAR
ncbi:MAG: MotA/TolQ/ExbB proton channel family protein [Wenzhouxiangellaceae bacterium]